MEKNKKRECFVFKAFDQYLGMKPRYIYRVVDEIRITPVPLVSKFYVGLIYYRGELFDVLQAGRLTAEGGLADDSGRIILLKWAGKKIGLIPEKIVGLTWISGEGEGEEEEYGPDGHSLRFIEPDDIWDMVNGFSDGSDKI